MVDTLFVTNASTWLAQNTSTTMMTTLSNQTNDTSGICCEDPVKGSAKNIFYALFMIILLLLSVFGNSVVILAVCLSNKLNDRSTFYFVASLACSDMVMAVFQIPFRILFKFHGLWCVGLGACYLRMLMDSVGNIASILNLFLISIDRFVAIGFPYRYVSLLSHSRAKLIIAIVWIISPMWAITGIFHWESSTSTFSVDITNVCFNGNRYYFLVTFAGLYLPILIVMTCIYSRILQVALVQIRKIKINTPKPIPNHLMPITKKSPNAAKKRWSANFKKGSLYQEIKATKSVAIVYFAFLLCWFPSLVLYFYTDKEMGQLEQWEKVDTSIKFALFYTFSDILPMINTMVNPVIYSFSNTMFRNAVHDVWRKFMGKAAKRDSIFGFASERATSQMVERSSCYSTSPMTSPDMRGYSVENLDKKEGLDVKFL